MAIRNKTVGKRKSRCHYTYKVTVSFELRHTFEGDDVEQAGEGGSNDVEPSDQALAKLENEVSGYIGNMYSIDKLGVWTDFGQLLGVVREPLADGSPPGDSERMENADNVVWADDSTPEAFILPYPGKEKD